MINKREKEGLNYGNSLKAFIGYSNDIQDVEEYKKNMQCINNLSWYDYWYD